MFTNIINKLKSRPSTKNVFNPYLNEAVANNLKIYFEYLYSTGQKDILLIGSIMTIKQYPHLFMLIIFILITHSWIIITIKKDILCLKI